MGDLQMSSLNETEKLIFTEHKLNDGKKKKNLTINEPHKAFNYSDMTFGYVWDVGNFSDVRKILDIIRLHDKRFEFDEKRKLVADFENGLERYRNDQTPFNSFLGKILKPIDHTKKYDRIVNPGRTRAAELIAGESARRFEYMAIGISKVKVFDGDYQLGQEVNRVKIKDQGFANAAGDKIKHSGTWTPGYVSTTIWEVAPVDLPAPSIFQSIWSRTVFPDNKPLIHIQNEDFFTITHTAYTSYSV